MTLTEYFKEAEAAKNAGSTKAIPNMSVQLQLLRDFSFLQGAMEIVGAVTRRIAANPSREEFAREFEELKEHLLDRRTASITRSLQELIKRDPVKGLIAIAQLIEMAKAEGIEIDLSEIL